MSQERFNARRGLFAASLMCLVSSLGCSQGLDFDALSKDSDAGPVSSSGGDAGAPSSNSDNGGKAGNDASSAGDDDGAASPYCASLVPAPTFCDDFDSTKALGALWDGTEDSNGIIAQDTIAYESSPSSLASKSEAILSGQSIRSVAKKSFVLFAGKPVTIRASFALKVDQFDPGSSALVTAFAFLFGVDGNFNQVVLNLSSTGGGVVAEVAENAQGATAADDGYELHGPFSKRPSQDKWTDVRIEMDIHDPTGTGNSLRVYFDSEPQYDGALVIPLKGGTPRMELGVGWATAPAAPWSVRYDNVVVDLKNL